VCEASCCFLIPKFVMLKPTISLLEPDPRYRDMVFQSFETREIRPVQIDDLRRMVASIELNTGVPATIIEEFDTGNIQLFPQGTPDVLRLCAEIINKLFEG
jgi:hypothetical protein